MTQAAAMRISRFRLGTAMWLLGTPGVVVMTVTTIPQFAQMQPSPAPANALVAATLVQTSLILALTAWLGAALSGPLGLRAPVTEAFLSGMDIRPAVRRQLLPGVLGGIAVAAVMVIAAQVEPPALQQASVALQIPVSARLLYGGITEEVMLRWGVMTLIAWLAWRFVQRRHGSPNLACMLVAVLVSALLFGAAHLPLVPAMGLALAPGVVAWVLVGNAVPGVIFGVLYWRRGLESAFVAHALGHLITSIAGVA